MAVNVSASERQIRTLPYNLVTMPGYLVDFGFPYDIRGDPAGPMQTVERLGEAILGVKRGDTRLTGLLPNTPVEIASASSR
jgi:hypothetical protein